MNAHTYRVEFECPDCGDVSRPAIGLLETGEYSCPTCGVAHHFDKAHATRLRDSIETNLCALRDALNRISGQ